VYIESIIATVLGELLRPKEASIMARKALTRVPHPDRRRTTNMSVRDGASLMATRYSAGIFIGCSLIVALIGLTGLNHFLINLSSIFALK